MPQERTSYLPYPIGPPVRQDVKYGLGGAFTGWHRIWFLTSQSFRAGVMRLYKPQQQSLPTLPTITTPTTHRHVGPMMGTSVTFTPLPRLPHGARLGDDMFYRPSWSSTIHTGVVLDVSKIHPKTWPFSQETP